ncbi:MAG: DUF4038 domain-containing protein [Phycisphaeraceae bacterium]|nr:DUF4038 domain-containing protein [Phycisphaeraceae bacterium]
MKPIRSLDFCGSIIAGWAVLFSLFGVRGVLTPGTASGETHHVWEKVEITLHAKTPTNNPYKDVTAWVDLTGPGFDRRCYGFWDGGNTFRVRVMATTPGQWTWRSGSNTSDPGLAGATGTFMAQAWTPEELAVNACRRGLIRATANGHAFEYADGTPFFMLGDTWWSIPTFRYHWYDDDAPRAIGPKMGFKEMVKYRVAQQYNCLALIVAFPHWANDDKPNRWNLPDGTVVRAAWQQAGTKSAKDMHNEAGERPFLFPGKIPGHEHAVPDLERINPKYFQTMVKKIDYLNAHGVIPFMEVARRDIGQIWQKYYPWPDSYARYIQYVWSRYQANNCLYSPIHFDTPSASIPAQQWNLAANQVIVDYGFPPFGTMLGTNSNPSSLRNWGHVDQAKWLQFHQIGNRRTHDCYAYLTEIFNASPPVPGINGEPYYDGMEDAQPGSDLAALYCRSAMYGSVLSGGLGGHIYGAGGWQGGLWSGEVEKASKWPIWEVIQWRSADQMRHLKTFILSEGTSYQTLIPSDESLSPNRAGKPKTNVGWAYCARTKSGNITLLYFERDCPSAVLSGLEAAGRYSLRWFNPRTGQWIEPARQSVQADDQGKLRLPPFPGGDTKSGDDWAMKVMEILTGRILSP